jgi:ABC-type bacteriocin/lantibiotic exporter with double-glycine peptidase domain
MFNYSLSLSLLVVLTSIILIGISAFNSYKINQITNIEILQQALVQKNLTEMINGIITIKSMGKEKLFFSNWKDAFSTQLKYSKQKGNWSAILSNISNTIQFIFPMVTIWLGSYNLKNHFFTLGMLVAFNALSSSFLQPIISLSSSYTDIVVLKTYLSKLYDIINTKPETGLSKDLYKKIDGNIALNNVYFKYTKFDLYTIKNVSLNINAGEKIAIVGRSGSGKSTLLKLLLGLYSPDNGEIYIDKTNISQINVRNYRNQIGIVLQEPQLFNASIKENIILGKNNVSEEELKLAANKAGIYDIIENCPLGLETIISENGINLSGGQRQKISLARALINNPKILFMDEPTSSLDNEAEKDFMNQIFKLDTTCIVISHRLSTIDKFSKVIVMDNGQIVECGTHYELMRNKRHYYNLYSNGI